MGHETLIRQLLKADQNRVEGRTEKRQLHGLQATHFAGTLRNAQGQSANVMLTVADGPAGKRYLLRYAGQNAQALQRALPGLREAESSFRELTPADRKAAQPWVIRSVSMPKGGFAELVRQSALEGMDPQAEARLKLMNSAYGEKGSGGVSTAPTAGQRVKTVR
jgi:predicted Zn-dependent protease